MTCGAMNSSGTLIHPPGRVTVGLSMVRCSSFINKIDRKPEMLPGLWPDKCVLGKFSGGHTTQIYHRYSCDVTWEQNCDPSRAYTGIGRVRLPLVRSMKVE